VPGRILREFELIEEAGNKVVLRETGEAGARKRRAADTRFREEFALVFLAAWGELAKAGLTGREWSVVAYMMSTISTDGSSPVFLKDIAEGTGMKPSNASGVVASLIERGVIIRRGRRLALSPEFVWKGKSSERVLRLRELGLAQGMMKEE